MNKRFFRNISVLVIVSLLLLATLQGLWVWRLYRDSLADFARRVESATYKSIYKAFRMDAVPGLTIAEQINIDLDRFALYIEPNLLELDALQSYNVEIIERQTNRVLMWRGERDISSPLVVQVDVDDDAVFALRLAIEKPHKLFLMRMIGLILSSAAIIILLGAVLIFLVKTMFRQRTIEQMRRDFTHNITHELKTPISVAVAATDAMRNFSADKDIERRSRYLAIVESQLTRLSAMVERILSVSVDGRKEGFNPSLFCVSSLFEEIECETNFNTTKEVLLTIETAADITIFADRFHIKNLLTTLVDNSIKYSSESVKITLTAKKEGDKCVITVADNGIGMAKEHQKHVFEKFYRVPTGDLQPTRGYGLGLYYAQQVVVMHGGEIALKSRLGEGTQITIKLPYDGEKDKNAPC